MAGKSTGADGFLRAVTDFIFVEDQPAPSDVIFIPGSRIAMHAEKAAALYHQGYAPFLLPSGRFAIGSQGFAGPDPAYTAAYPGRYDSEWAYFRDVLLRRGVPDSAILREDQATFTWENALLSRAVTDRAGVQVRQAILCCQSYHARRALFYYQAAYPEAAFLVCPAPIAGLSRGDWHQSAEGRACILGEMRRLGSQINEVLESMMQ